MAIEVRSDLLLIGEDIKINDNITITNPTVGEILKYGEKEYYGVVSGLTATAYQYMLFLYKNGINYLEVSDYETFLMSYKGFDSKKTELILNGLDLSSLKPMVNQETEQMVLTDEDENIIIDEAIYSIIVAYIRKINNIKREYKMPGNKKTMEIYIEDALFEEEKAKRSAPKPFESTLEPIISSMCNHSGFKYNHLNVKDISIYTLMDSVKRIQIYENYRNLISAVYAGTIDFKSIKKDELNWLKSI